MWKRDWGEFRLLLKSKGTKLTLENSAVFDEESALKIGWMARLRHYNRLINDYKGACRSALATDEEDLTYAIDKMRNASLVAFDFLRLIGIANETSTRKQFLKELKKSFDIVASKNPNDSATSMIGQAKILAIVRAVHIQTKGCAIQGELLEECSRVLDMLLPPESYNSPSRTLARKRAVHATVPTSS